MNGERQSTCFRLFQHKEMTSWTTPLTRQGMEWNIKGADKAVEFRFAKPQDIPLILRFIRELADYEGMLDQVVATEELQGTSGCLRRKRQEVILGMKDGETVGFALFFHNFSTFLEGPAYIWRTCMCARSTGARASAPPFEPAGSHCSGTGVRTPGWWCLDWN